MHPFATSAIGQYEILSFARKHNINIQLLFNPRCLVLSFSQRQQKIESCVTGLLGHNAGLMRSSRSDRASN